MHYMSQWRGTPIYSSGPAAESRELSNYEDVPELAWRPMGQSFLPRLSSTNLVLGAAIAVGAWWYFKGRKNR